MGSKRLMDISTVLKKILKEINAYKKKIIIILILLLITFPCSAQEITELHGIKTEKKEENKTSDFILAGTFLIGQTFNTGNMIFQQESGYYEVNPGYGKHPGRDTIYALKAIETISVLGSAWFFKDYRKEILIPANVIVWGTITGDLFCGIQAKVEF